MLINKEKLLFVLGGTRIGDTFHVAPYLNFLRQTQKVELTWIHGSYAKDAVNLLAKHTDLADLITSTFELPDGFSGDIHNVRNFSNEFNQNSAYIKRDGFKYFISGDESFTWSHRRIETPLGVIEDYADYAYINLLNPGTTKDYIAVQPFTRSNWKNLDTILNISYPLPTKSVGLPNETLLPGAEDWRGKPLEEVAKMISGARVFVGQHSSMSILAFYLGVPTVIIHFMPGLFQLSDFHSNCKDLFKPTTSEIRTAIDELLNRGVSNDY